MFETTKPVHITQDEANLLIDLMSVFNHPLMDEDGELLPNKETLLKIGAAFASKEGADLVLDELELWFITSLVKSTQMVGSNMTGYNLLQKSYAALIEIENEDIAAEALEEIDGLFLGSVDEKGREGQSRNEQLRLILEEK